MLNKLILNVSLGVLCLFGTSVNATPIIYLGADDNVSTISDMVNSQTTLSDFLAVTGSLNVVDFESALPSFLTITGGTTSNDSGCGVLCGFNTSAGGSFMRSVSGGSVTFSFSNPVDAFGFFVNGLQTDLVPQQTLIYTDGSSVEQTIDFPSSIGGGGAFVGFIDYGQLISSVTFNATNDVLAFDDLRFGLSQSNPVNSVPEPSSIVLLGLGIAGFGWSKRKKI